MWLEITVHQYFNPIANKVASQENYSHKSRHQQDSTGNNFVSTDNNGNSALKC